MNAAAYTVGSHIFFGAGSYNPLKREGLWLLAHELAHVVGRNPLARAYDHVAPVHFAIDRLNRRALLSQHQGFRVSLKCLPRPC